MSDTVDRTDNVGLLARRLIGDENTPPDLTAAPPLFDALCEDGDRDTAVRLRNVVCQHLPMCQSADQGHLRMSHRQEMRRQLQSVLFEAVGVCTVDFNSACMALDQFVHTCDTPDEVRSGKLELATQRMRVEGHVRPGHRVPLDDGTMGLVVTARDVDGFVDVIPTESDQTVGEGSDGPMGYSPPRNVRRRFR
jgi:hypothetical protein